MLDYKKLEEALARDLCLAGEQKAFPTTLISPDEDGKIAEFRARYQMYNFTRKLEPKVLPEEQRASAFANHLANQKRALDFSSFDYPWVERAADIISTVLPPLALIEDQMWPMCSFGPGTFNDNRRVDPLSYSLHYKIGHDQTVTPQCRQLFLSVLLEYFPRWADKLSRWGRKLKIVDGDRLSHVVNTTSKCRPIAPQPSANVFLQQGPGRWLIHHMQMIGFADLRHGQARNRALAADLRNATIDLSNASETIYTSLVKRLLPPDWFELLDTLRCHVWQYRGERGHYNSFCSQGNAFTFPLETLIFKAIVMAATELSMKEVTVYGDDIIVPVTSAPSAIQALGEAGFIVNKDKSFYGQHGDERDFFRESCGADYYRGVNVTPMYCRKPCSKLSDMAVVFNRLSETWPSARRAISFIILSIPEKLRRRVIFGPQYFITDSPEQWLEHGDKIQRGGYSYNVVVSCYSNWFWAVGPFEGKDFSYRRWTDEAVPIKKGDLLGTDVSYSVSLYGADDVLPRSTNPRTRKCEYTPCEPGIQGFEKVTVVAGKSRQRMQGSFFFKL